MARREDSSADPQVLKPALIINGGPLAPALTSIVDADVAVLGIDDLTFVIDAGRVRITENIDGRDLAGFGLVQVAAYPRPTASVINALTDYLDHHGVPTINMRGIAAPTKLAHYVRFAQAGLPVPDTFYSSPQVLSRSFPLHAQHYDMPFILKALSASGGRDNVLVRNERDFHATVEAREHHAANLLAQQFIPSDTTYRLLVLGEDVVLIIRRTWAPGTHLTNTQQGGACALVPPEDFDPAAQTLARDAAALIGSEVAGINLIQHWTTGQWFILDANVNPAIASGVFVEQKLAAYRSYIRDRIRRTAPGVDKTRPRRPVQRPSPPGRC